MRQLPILLALLAAAWVFPAHADPAPGATSKTRIVVVDSYHREYLWSQDTNEGVVSALLDFGYLDDQTQADAYTRNDYVESSTAQVHKLWMDTKRRNGPSDIADAVAEIVAAIERVGPSVILLGDDNAANYLGNYYMDRTVPVVFWGINGTPLKYGLLDSIQRPGHNVTGVYQAGYLREGLAALKAMLPEVESFAVLSDDSPTGRSKAKQFLRWARRVELPLRLVDVVVTNDFEEWKRRALELSHRVDAFFILNHNTLRDASGNGVDQLEAGRWYLANINKPDVAHERQFVTEGIMTAVEDSGFKQGYEAVRIVHRILSDGENPADISVYAPDRGPVLVNADRARMLGVFNRVSTHPLVEEIIEDCLACGEHL